MCQAKTSYKNRTFAFQEREVADEAQSARLKVGWVAERGDELFLVVPVPDRYMSANVFLHYS